MLLPQVKTKSFRDIREKMSLSKRKLSAKSILLKSRCCKEESTQSISSETIVTESSESHFTTEIESSISIADSASSHPETSNKSVKFDKVETIKIEKVNKRMRKKLWYNESELQSSMQHNTQLIEQAMKIGFKSVDSQPKQTLRGLEFALPNNVLTKKRHEFQNGSRKAVLNEQQRQKELGILDGKLIKKMYRLHGAKSSRDVARNLGLYDEGVAIDIQKEVTAV